MARTPLPGVIFLAAPVIIADMSCTRGQTQHTTVVTDELIGTRQPGDRLVASS